MLVHEWGASFAFFAFILALATAKVAAKVLAILVGSKDVDGAYPGARLDCPMSLVGRVPYGARLRVGCGAYALRAWPCL